MRRVVVPMAKPALLIMVERSVVLAQSTKVLAWGHYKDSTKFFVRSRRAMSEAITD